MGIQNFFSTYKIYISMYISNYCIIIITMEHEDMYTIITTLPFNYLCFHLAFAYHCLGTNDFFVYIFRHQRIYIYYILQKCIINLNAPLQLLPIFLCKMCIKKRHCIKTTYTYDVSIEHLCVCLRRWMASFVDGSWLNWLLLLFLSLLHKSIHKYLNKFKRIINKNSLNFCLFIIIT